MWGESDATGPLAMAGVVREVSSVSVPQFNDARINQGAALVTFTTPKGKIMPPTAPPAAPPAAAAGTEIDAPTFSLEELAKQLEPFLANQRKDPHRLAAFASLADYYDQAFDGTVEPFALLDQITGDNPGVVPPSWLSEIQRIIAVDRPSITAFGSTPAPTSGMTINWPYFNGDIKTLVAKQAPEKTEIHSVKVSFLKGAVDLATYAGGSDISYQLLKRSSPEYRAAYMELLLSGYNYLTDAVFIAAVAAGATGVGPVWDPATGTAAALRSALFAASMAVRTATGQPATVAVAADDVFLAIAGLDGLYPGPYGTQNVSGTADAASLAINVSGIPVVNDPWAADGTFVVGNGRSAKWIEDGPYTATAEDVTKLGQDNAIWGMGASGIFNPAGLVGIAPRSPVVAARARASPPPTSRRPTTSRPTTSRRRSRGDHGRGRPNLAQARAGFGRRRRARASRRRDQRVGRHGPLRREPAPRQHPAGRPLAGRRHARGRHARRAMVPPAQHPLRDRVVHRQRRLPAAPGRRRRPAAAPDTAGSGMTLAGAIVDTLAAFEGAGVHAVDDVRDVSPPCVYVIPPEGSFRFDRHRLTIEWVAYLVVPNAGTSSSTRALSDLVDQVAGVASFTTFTRDAVQLPDGATPYRPTDCPGPLRPRSETDQCPPPLTAQGTWGPAPSRSG